MSAFLRRLPALAVAASIAWTTGCGIETEVTGITADADIRRPDLMHVLAHGANLELSHMHLIDYNHFVSAGTDEQTNGYNSSSSYRRRAVNQYQNRPDYVYSQANESGWVAAYAAERMREVNNDEGTDPNTDPLIAHMRINSALAMQWLAEGQCVACVGWGPEGGNLLPGPDPYDNTTVVDSDSIMKMAITWAELAEPVAQGAIAAGRLNEYEPDFEHFIPQNSLYASYAIRAMGYLWLEDYQQADQFASQVPIDFKWHMFSHEDNSWANRWIYYTHRYALTTTWGSAIATTFKDVDDPRIPWVVCGEYKEGLTVGGRRRSSSEYVDLRSTEGCKEWPGTSGRYRTYDGDLPNYIQQKYMSENDDLVMLSGLEMKLVRAEIALRNNNLAQFTTYINEVRDFYGLDPINQPATAGALEYPNAEDDAWSILDRESLFTLWLDARRYANFRRWEHPFWTGGHYKTPDEADDNNGLHRPKYTRADGSLDWCMPLPDGEECNVNDGVRLTEWCKTLYAPGEGPTG